LNIFVKRELDLNYIFTLATFPIEKIFVAGYRRNDDMSNSYEKLMLLIKRLSQYWCDGFISS